MEIADKIKLIRENILGLSISEFSELCGVTPKTIYNWEYGISAPCLGNIVTIASECHVTVDYLLDKEQPLEFNFYDIDDEAIEIISDVIKKYKKLNSKSI